MNRMSRTRSIHSQHRQERNRNNLLLPVMDDSISPVLDRKRVTRKKEFINLRNLKNTDFNSPFISPDKRFVTDGINHPISTFYEEDEVGNAFDTNNIKFADYLTASTNHHHQDVYHTIKSNSGHIEINPLVIDTFSIIGYNALSRQNSITSIPSKMTDSSISPNAAAIDSSYNSYKIHRKDSVPSHIIVKQQSFIGKNSRRSSNEMLMKEEEPIINNEKRVDDDCESEFTLHSQHVIRKS